MKKRTLAAAAALTLIVTGTAIAHKGATGMVKMRMDAMSAIGDNMKSISAMLTGKTTFDGALLSTQAREISDHATTFPDHFMMQMDDQMTEASPAIWEKPDEFKKQSAVLAELANALSAKAAEATMGEALTADFQAVAGTCKSCHEQFRIKK
ncbi:MAG: cytochrome c [Salaquimonas sp.]